MSRAPRTCCVQLIKYTTIWFRLSGRGGAEVVINFAEELRHAESNPTFKIHESHCTSRKKLETKFLRSEWFAQVNLISVAPTHKNLRIGLRRRQSGKSKVPAKQTAKLAKSVLQLKDNNKATFFSPSENWCLPASTLKPEEPEFVVDSEASMHMISQKDLNDAEMDTLTKSRSPTIVITANWEVQTHEEATILSKSWIDSCLWKSSKTRQQYCRLESFALKNGYSYEWINGQKPHLIKYGIRIQCNTENFVPIVVPGLSTSSSSSSHLATSRTPSRQKRHHSTSSSRSSSSPATTVSSDSETREREDQSEIYSHPVPVSSSNVDDRTGKPVVCRETNHEQGRQAKPKIPKNKWKGNHDRTDQPVVLPTQVERRCIPIYRSGRKSSEKIWWMIEFLNTEIHTPVLFMKYLWSPHPREVRIWVSTEFFSYFHKDRNCEICQRTKITRAPCRRRNGGAVPDAENFGDLITADHKVSICNRGAGLGHPMDPVVSVQNFSGNTKELAKVLGAEKEA